MNRFVAQPLSDDSYVLAEGPTWDEESQLLAWVDIPAGDVHVARLLESGLDLVRSHHLDTFASAVAFADGNDLVVAGRHTVWRVDPAGNAAAIADVIPGGQARRLNDGCCDPAGRFLVGSLSLGEAPGTESLHRLTAGAGTQLLDDDLFMSNGIAWSPDGQTLYTIDTTPGIVWSRRYDPASGATGPREELLHITDGSPDGLCIDKDGRLWIAVWGPGEVRCFDPSGRQVAVVDVPAPHTTSASFAGPLLDQLVITTASDELDAEQRARYPDSGRLFVADVETSGLAATRWG